MANSTLGTGPWIIDTASATPITTDAIRIKQIVWVPGSGAVAGNECKVTDNSATPIVYYDQFATGASEDAVPRVIDTDYPTNGLIVPTLGAGKVYVYLK
jgi:hypothetical protein